MLNKTQFGGVVTWDGTLNVGMTLTAGVVAGSWIKQENTDESLYFKVDSVVLNVKAVILNPDSFPVPDGGAQTAFVTEEGIRDEIVNAPDLVNTPETEPITEPVAPPGKTRKTADVYSSVTVQVGKKYRVDYTFKELASSDEHDAVSGSVESIV